jgi:hypothetical protein
MTLVDTPRKDARDFVTSAEAGGDRANLLIKEARQLRRRRWVVLVTAAAVIVAIVATVTGGSSPTKPPLPTFGGKSPTFHLARLSKSATTVGLLDFLMPTDGADFAKGRAFADRMRFAAATTQLSCMARKGEPATGRVTTAREAGDNLDYPDLAVLSAGTFQSVASGTLYQFNGPDAAKGMKTEAFDLARQHCGTTAYGAENQLLETGGIVNTWEGKMEPAINQSAGFKAHDANYGSCLRAAGLTRTMLWSDNSTLETAIGPTLFAATLHYRSSTYARCIAPVEHWRDQVRSVQRAQVIASHSTELSHLEAQVYAYLHV